MLKLFAILCLVLVWLGASPTAAASDDCSDVHKDCGYWSERFHCADQYAKWMVKYCRGSCNVNNCKGVKKFPASQCNNVFSTCGWWSDQGYCQHTKYQEWMRKYCRTSCQTPGCDQKVIITKVDVEQSAEAESAVGPPPPPPSKSVPPPPPKVSPPVVAVDKKPPPPKVDFAQDAKVDVKEVAEHTPDTFLQPDEGKETCVDAFPRQCKEWVWFCEIKTVVKNKFCRASCKNC